MSEAPLYSFALLLKQVGDVRFTVSELNEIRVMLLSSTKQPKVEQKTYFLFGVLCGMALYNHNIVHMPFPLVLFKKLLRVKPSLDDMKEFDSVLGE